jgi:hypothetical protein
MWSTAICTDSYARSETSSWCFFTRGDHLQNLIQVMLYIRENEHTDRVKFVHVYRILWEREMLVNACMT